MLYFQIVVMEISRRFFFIDFCGSFVEESFFFGLRFAFGSLLEAVSPVLHLWDFRLLEVLGGVSLGSLLEAVPPVLKMEDFRLLEVLAGGVSLVSLLVVSRPLEVVGGVSLALLPEGFSGLVLTAGLM